MPIQLKDVDDAKLLVVHVTGKLVRADYEHFVPEFERLLRLHGKLRVLFDMTGFQGWDAGAMWEDIKFDVKHFGELMRVVAGDYNLIVENLVENILPRQQVLSKLRIR